MVPVTTTNPSELKGKMNENEIMQRIEGRRFIEQTIETFKDYYVQGLSMTAISKKRNITRQGVYMTLRRL
jgi:predicted DNA-binding protein YlxM (UPF0122 family)